MNSGRAPLPLTPMNNFPDSSYPIKDISQPHDNDVLLCRAGAGGQEDPSDHAGSILWRMLVAANKPMYANLPRRQRSLLSKSIVNAVRLSQNPPGRFLQKDRRTKLWFDAGDQRAEEETSRALREGEVQNAGGPASALNAAATIQQAHSTATAKQQQAAAAAAAVDDDSDSKIPAKKKQTQGDKRRASTSDDAVSSMLNLIDKPNTHHRVEAATATGGVAARRTGQPSSSLRNSHSSIEPTPLRGSFLASAAALSIEPTPMAVSAGSAAASAAASSRLGTQMMPQPPRTLSAAAAHTPAPVTDAAMMMMMMPPPRRISAPPEMMLLPPPSRRQQAPLKAPPPQYSSNTKKTKTAATAADRGYSSNSAPTIEELALLRILRP